MLILSEHSLKIQKTPTIYSSFKFLKLQYLVTICKGNVLSSVSWDFLMYIMYVQT